MPGDVPVRDAHDHALSLSLGGGGFLQIVQPDGVPTALTTSDDTFNGHGIAARVGLFLVARDTPQEFQLGFRYFQSARSAIDSSKLLKQLGLDLDQELSIGQFLDLERLPPEVRTAIEDSSTPVTLRELLLSGAPGVVTGEDRYYLAELVWRIHIGGLQLSKWFSLQPKVGTGLALGAHVAQLQVDGQDTDTSMKFAAALMLEGGAMMLFHLTPDFVLGVDTTILATIGRPTFLHGDAALYGRYTF